ncbi:putative leader peptide [Amycolatopsis sp. NPDC059657]|uniref:putative leader peptide n=1 Tax=Amycolatopsis sp. NPDC059657 TaxID=3346899 RepID=UPI00366F3A16
MRGGNGGHPRFTARPLAWVPRDPRRARTALRSPPHLTHPQAPDQVKRCYLSMRSPLDHIVGTWHAARVTRAGIRLVARRHVDLRRVASALCAADR